MPARENRREMSRAGGQTSDPLTVLSNRAAPPSTDIYNQTIPASGYGYLTTRDGTTRTLPVVEGAFLASLDRDAQLDHITAYDGDEQVASWEMPTS